MPSLCGMTIPDAKLRHVIVATRYKKLIEHPNMDGSWLTFLNHQHVETIAIPPRRD